MPLGYVQAVQDIALGIYKDRAFFRDFVPSCFRDKNSYGKKNPLSGGLVTDIRASVCPTT